MDIKEIILNLDYNDRMPLHKILIYCYEEKLKNIYYILEDFSKFIKYLENNDKISDRALNDIKTINNWMENSFNGSEMINLIDNMFNKHNLSYQKLYTEYTNKVGKEKIDNEIWNEIDYKIKKWKGLITEVKIINIITDSKDKILSYQNNSDFDVTTQRGISYINDKMTYQKSEVSKSRKQKLNRNLEIRNEIIVDRDEIIKIINMTSINEINKELIINLWKMILYYKRLYPATSKFKKKTYIYVLYLIKLNNYKDISILKLNSLFKEYSNLPNQDILSFYTEFFKRGYSENYDVSDDIYLKLYDNFNKLSYPEITKTLINNLKNVIQEKIKDKRYIKIFDIIDKIFNEFDIGEKKKITVTINEANKIINEINKEIDKIDSDIKEELNINFADYLFDFKDN